MRRGTAKDALMRLRWKDRLADWSDVRIVIRHHGAPGDEKTVGGTRITDLGATFFEIDHETRIPYHRILRIDRGNEPLYERSSASAKRS